MTQVMEPGRRTAAGGEVEASVEGVRWRDLVEVVDRQRGATGFGLRSKRLSESDEPTLKKGRVAGRSGGMMWESGWDRGSLER